jgi:hypothetical protein
MRDRRLRIAAFGGLLAAFQFALPARAVIGTIDQVPAATLLLPYFEVDLGDSNGRTTLFSINNASASPVLTHVVIWSDLSVPVLDFNCYLTGYDVQTLNLRDVLAGGRLCQTASVGQDPQDTISPKGPLSGDIDFPSCTGLLPPPPLPPFFLSHLHDSLTGRFSSVLNGCAGQRFGDDVARGYVTVDTVRGCTLRFPGDPGYFAPGGTGDATDQNVLWGDYITVDPSGPADGETLVAVEASPTDPRTTTSGQYTFYGRYVGWTAADNREPLATSFAVRYTKQGLFDSGSCLTVWRDSKVPQSSFKCGTLPSWYPLGQEKLLLLDEEETAQVPTTFPVSPQPPGEVVTPFPAETQCTVVGGDELPVTFDFGWAYLNLNTFVTAAGANPHADPAAAQGWVTVSMSAQGRFSVGFNAVQLDNALAPSHLDPEKP